MGKMFIGAKLWFYSIVWASITIFATTA